MINNFLFKKNRKKLFNKLPEKSLVLLTSNIIYPRNGDQYFPFRQESNYYYLTGLNVPGTKLILYPDKITNELNETLFIQKPDNLKELWDGTMLNYENAKEITGIDDIRFFEDWKETVSEALNKFHVIYLDFEEQEKSFFSYKKKFHSEIKNEYPETEVKNLQPYLTECRLIKESEEIDLIKKAISITKKALLEVLPMISPGMGEFEIAAQLDYHFKLNKATGQVSPR